MGLSYTQKSKMSLGGSGEALAFRAGSPTQAWPGPQSSSPQREKCWGGQRPLTSGPALQDPQRLRVNPLRPSWKHRSASPGAGRGGRH